MIWALRFGARSALWVMGGGRRGGWVRHADGVKSVNNPAGARSDRDRSAGAQDDHPRRGGACRARGSGSAAKRPSQAFRRSSKGIRACATRSHRCGARRQPRRTWMWVPPTAARCPGCRIRSVSDAIALEPRNAAAWDAREGVARLGMIAPALVDVHRARYFAPERAHVRNTLGTILERAGAVRRGQKCLPRCDPARRTRRLGPKGISPGLKR